MGNLCSKSSNPPDNFHGPGRTLDSGPPPKPTSASIPSQFKTTPGRPLGGGGAGNPSQPPPAAAAAGSSTDADARERARQAAEARYAQNQTAQGKGKLGQQLAEQKKKTRNDVLKELSESERRVRDADEAAAARAHN